MKTPLRTNIVTALLLLVSGVTVRAQDHGHLRIAARSTAQGAQLYFFNGSDFASSNRYVKTLVFTNSGRYAGYFQQNITFTVQAATSAFGGPEPNAPALGSYIRARILSVEGPEGGAFGFWEAGANSPTISVAAGQTGTSSFNVTQTDGSPGVDPFGHIHGRRFSVTREGIYIVSFQAFDTSTNGLNGGPIHTPSDVIKVAFQGGVNVQSVEPDFEEGHVHVWFGAMAGFDWQVQYSTNIATNALWFPAENPRTGNDYFIEVLHELHPGTKRFYRVGGSPTPPP